MKFSRPVVRGFIDFLKLRLQTFGESVSAGSTGAAWPICTALPMPSPQS
jgi:hypothetical protein